MNKINYLLFFIFNVNGRKIKEINENNKVIVLIEKKKLLWENFLNTPFKKIIKENKIITGLVIGVPTIFIIYFTSNFLIKRNDLKKINRYLDELKEIQEEKKTTDKVKLKDLYNKEMEIMQNINRIDEKYFDDNKAFEKINNDFIKIKEKDITNSKITKNISDYIIEKIKNELNKEEIEEFLFKYNIAIIDFNDNNIQFLLTNIDRDISKVLNKNWNDPLENKIKNILKKFVKIKDEKENKYSINNSLIETNNQLYELNLYQGGLRNNIAANCLLISLENGLIHNLYKIQKIGNKKLLERYYLSLLNYNNFLTEIENIKEKLSPKETHLIDETFNTYDQQLFMNNDLEITNIFLKKIKIIPIKNINCNLTNEKFYELIQDNIDKINNILRNILKKTNPLILSLNIIFILAIYNVYISSTDLKNYFIPNYITLNPPKTNLNNELLSVIPAQYILINNMGHVYYSIYSSTKEEHEDVKKFMENWYNWINKKQKDFIKIKFIDNIY